MDTNPSLPFYNLHPELIQDVMQNLLNKQVSKDKARDLLKQEDEKTFEPTMIMNMRHDQIRQEHEQNENKRQIYREARRQVETEEKAERERVREMRAVDREIKKFQEQLHTEHKKLINNYNSQRIPEKRLWTVSSNKNTSPIIAVRATRKKSCNLKNMKNSDYYREEYLDVKTIKVEKIHHHEEFECEEGNQKFIEVSIKKFDGVSSSTNIEEPKVRREILQKPFEGVESEEEKHFQTNSDADVDKREYEVMKKVWTRWTRLIHRKRIEPSKQMKHQIQKRIDETKDTITISDGQGEKTVHQELRKVDEKKFDDDEMDEFNGDCADNFKNEYYLKNYQNQKNTSILKKYFKKWKHWITQMKELELLKVEKQRREDKIKKYIEIIRSQKKKVSETKQSPSPEIDSQASMSDFLDSSSKSIKSLSSNSSLGSKYKHRFEAQKNIIARQKSKIEDQTKVIEDLKSFQLKLEAEMSQRESSKNLKATLNSFDPRLKSKAAFIQRALSSDSGYKSLDRLSEGSSETLDEAGKQMSTKTKSLSLEIVQRMERRNEERRKKWLAAQERRKQFEEERLLKIKEEEEMRQRRELEAKQRKIEELKEKQRLEKLREEEKIRERETYQRNYKIADESDRRRLLMKGLKKLRRNVLITKRDSFIASDHYKTRLKQKYICYWKVNIQQVVVIKISMATQFYHHRLVQKTFQQLFNVYKDYVQKQQAADDMYDMKIQSKYFKQWYDFTCEAYLKTQDKLKIAVNFYNRRILRSHFNQWKKLPKIMFQERSREQRLRVLRERVQELLPDFCPVPQDEYN